MTIMNKNLFQLTAEELLEMVPVIRHNSMRLQNTGKLVGNSEDYGTAVSLLILSAEEQLKAFFVQLEGNGFAFRKSKVLKGLFFNHRPRHALIREAFSVWIFFNEWLIKDPLHSGSRQTFASRFLEGIGRGYLTKKWWEKADDLKQRGFYVDYRDGLINPSTTTKEQYDEALRHTVRFQEQSDQWMNKVSKMNHEMMMGWKTLFENANLETLLEESINRHAE
jgi:AbiV family abortive infection protein